MAKISGILTDGAGQIINDCTIELYAKKTTSNVLTQTQAFTVANDGRYSMNVLPCDYDVSLIINGFPKKRLGTINVYSNSANGTLNDFLINPKESELTPEFIKQVMDARDDAKKSANNAQKWASTIDTSTLVKKSGDTMTGQLILSEFGIKHRYTDSENMMVSRTRGDNYAHIFYDANKKQWQDKLIYNSTKNSWSFQYVDDVTINNKAVLKTGDYGIGSLTGAQLDNPDETLLGGCYATRTTSFPELTEYKNRNDSASLIVYPAWTTKWYVEKLAVVYSKTPRIYYRCATPDGKQTFYESITTANINNYIPVGDFRLMPFRANELPFGWYFRNGDNYLLSSPQGQALNRLSNNYKRDHQIKIKDINGQQYINVPSAFTPDGRGFFERAVNGTTRKVGSTEGDAIRNITGLFLSFSSLDLKLFYQHSMWGTGAQIATGDCHSMSVNGFDASRVVPTANENRPINIGLTPAIYLGV